MLRGLIPTALLMSMPAGHYSLHNTGKPISTLNIHATIVSGPLKIARSRNSRVLDITGREAPYDNLKPGIYFIEVEGDITHKIIKIH